MKNWLSDTIVKHQMTKKHFEAFATAFGHQLRFIDATNLDQIKAFWLAVASFESTAKQLNPNFDANKFGEWVADVAENRRDVNGKKIKGAK